MNSSSPKKQAIIIAFITAIFTFTLSLVVLKFDTTTYIIFQAFIGLMIFLVVYLTIFYSLNNFIYKKLKPIYKTIQNVNFSEEQLKRKMEEKDSDIAKEAQDDVLVWAKKKTREIAQLRQLEKYRREFLGNVSHELKTPIFNIQGYISTLLDGGLEDETINTKYLERAEKSVNRLISIVDDLESISRLESGELKLEYSSFSIVQLFEEVFEEHEMLAAERNISLKFNDYPDKALPVNADRLRIQDVLNNLIGNSIKYGRIGGKTIVDFLDMDDHIMIEVSDNGVGMSEKDLPRIFERFYRTDKSRSREMGGTGLGLSIVKHVIEGHRQTINVRSELNKGSAFTFTLMKA